jgi:hypothetical protein
MASTTNATQNGNGHGAAKVQLKDTPISRIVVTELRVARRHATT